ncbi:MAG: hypothetical protein COV65_07035, partial [Nitrosopumilales archaeon CG11_big_fil_rev_8_21_14_0_20_33_24]
IFGFITIEPRGDSNIKTKTQFIDEIEIDSPTPFNIPLEFNGEPRYGEHDIRLIVRYKDSVRDETLFTHDATIFIKEPPKIQSDNNFMLIIPLIVAAAIGFYMIRRRKKSKIQTS